MFKCEYCGRDLLASIEDYDAWQLDHVVPTSKEGPDSFENLALCCKACNFMKLRYTPIGATREAEFWMRVGISKNVGPARPRSYTEFVP